MKSIWLSLIAFSATACSPGMELNSSHHISGAEVLASSAPAAAKAEQIAEDAEALIDAEAFQPADDMAALALTQDPTNFRARLLRSALAPVLLVRGFATRAQPVAQKDAGLAADLQRMILDLRKRARAQNIESFVLDGQADLQTESQTQIEADKIIKAMLQFRSFMKDEARNQEITFQVPASFLTYFTERYAKACQVTVNAKYEYDLTCPANSTRKQVTLNRADFEVLIDAVTFYLSEIAIPNSYDLTNGIPAIVRKAKDPSSSSQAIADELLNSSVFGHLRNASSLKLMRSMGLDVILGLRWAMANQVSLCPTGSSTPHDRTGMLFNDGICVPAVLNPYLDNLVPVTVNGPSRVTATDGTNSLTTNVYWAALFDHPLVDLHQLGPVKFDNDNVLTYVTEPTAGGMFPNGDVNAYLAIKFPAITTK